MRASLLCLAAPYVGVWLCLSAEQVVYNGVLTAYSLFLAGSNVWEVQPEQLVNTRYKLSDNSL